MVTDEQKREAYFLLNNGYSIREVSKIMDLSSVTVQKIKKADPKEFGISDEKLKLLKDNITLLTPKEKSFVEKQKMDKLIYSDREEGWMWHVSKQELKNMGSGHCFLFIFYPESADPRMKERLIELGLPFALSPIHDMDKWSHDSPESDGEIWDEEQQKMVPHHYEQGELYKAGDKKKKHGHGIIKTPKNMSLREINELVRPITRGPYLQKCIRSEKSAFEYLTHIGEDPDKKYPYYRDGVEPEVFNGFLVEMTKTEKNLLLQNVIQTIREKHIDTVDSLYDEYSQSCDALAVIGSHTGMIRMALSSEYNKKRPGTSQRDSMHDIAKSLRTIATGEVPEED